MMVARLKPSNGAASQFLAWNQRAARRLLARERVRRAAVEDGEIRGGVSEGLRHRARSAGLDRPIPGDLQPA